MINRTISKLRLYSEILRVDNRTQLKVIFFTLSLLLLALIVNYTLNTEVTRETCAKVIEFQDLRVKRGLVRIVILEEMDTKKRIRIRTNKHRDILLGDRLIVNRLDSGADSSIFFIDAVKISCE